MSVISGNKYEKIARLYGDTVRDLLARDSKLYDAVVSIVGIQTGEGDVKVDLLRTFGQVWTFMSEQSESSLLQAVRRINQHVLNRGQFANLDRFLETEQVVVSEEWAALCRATGFAISDAHIG